MFVLTRISDVIPVNPELFDADYTKVLVEEIDRKYANKVIADVGLCITIYDFVHIGDAFVHPSDGTSHSQGMRPCVLASVYPLMDCVGGLTLLWMTVVVVVWRWWWCSRVPHGGLPPIRGRSAQGPHR